MTDPKRRGLGRGLGSLIPSGNAEEPGSTTRLAEVAGAHFAELPVGVITPNPRQPREVFEEEAMAELVHSIREVGLLQPVVVRPLPDSDRYELVMGERRWRATQAAGLTTIPAINVTAVITRPTSRTANPASSTPTATSRRWLRPGSSDR